MAILDDAINIASIVHFSARFAAFDDFRIASIHVDGIFVHLAAVAVYPILAVVLTRFIVKMPNAVVIESRFRLVSRIITPCLATELSDCFINLCVRNLALCWFSDVDRALLILSLNKQEKINRYERSSQRHS